MQQGNGRSPLLRKELPPPQASKLVRLEAKIPVISLKQRQINEQTASMGVNTKDSDAATQLFPPSSIHAAGPPPERVFNFEAPSRPQHARIQIRDNRRGQNNRLAAGNLDFRLPKMREKHPSPMSMANQSLLMQKRGNLWKSSDYSVLAEQNFVQSLEKRTSLGDPVPHLEARNVRLVKQPDGSRVLKRKQTSKAKIKSEPRKHEKSPQRSSIRDYITSMETQPKPGKRSSSRQSKRGHNTYMTAREQNYSTIRQHRKALELKRRKASMHSIDQQMQEMEKLTASVAKKNPLYYQQLYHHTNPPEAHQSECESMPKLHSPRFPRDVSIPGVQSLDPAQMMDDTSSSKFYTHFTLPQQIATPRSSSYTMDFQQEQSSPTDQVRYAESKEMRRSVHHYHSTVDPRVNRNCNSIIYVNDNDQQIFKMQQQRPPPLDPVKLSKAKLAASRSVSKLSPPRLALLPAECEALAEGRQTEGGGDLQAVARGVALVNRDNFDQFLSEIRMVQEQADADVMQTANYLKLAYSMKFYTTVAKQVLLLMGVGTVANPRPQLGAGRARDLLFQVWDRVQEYAQQIGNFDLLFLAGKIRVDVCFEFIRVEQAIDQLKKLKKQCTDRGELVHKLVCCAQLGHCFRSLERHDQALHAFKKQLQLAWATSDKNAELLAYDNIGLSYYYLGDCKRAEYYHDRMVGGETEGPDSATKKSSLNMMQNKQMSRWEKLSSIAKDLHDSFRLDAKKRSIEEKLKDLPSPHSTSNKNAHERYKSMIMKDEELSGPRPKADILLSKQNEISAQAFKYQVMGLDKQDRMSSKAACFYSPQLQYLNQAPSKRKYLKVADNPPSPTRAKTPVKKRKPGMTRHQISKSLASALKIDTRNQGSGGAGKKPSLLVDTDLRMAARYPPFPDTEKASLEAVEEMKQQRKVNLSLYLRMQNSITRLSGNYHETQSRLLTHVRETKVRLPIEQLVEPRETTVSLVKEMSQLERCLKNFVSVLLHGTPETRAELFKKSRKHDWNDQIRGWVERVFD